MPIDGSRSEFSFHINSPRVNEKKWLGLEFLFRPLTENFEITYSIKSKRSDGTLKVTIQYRK